jgi:pyruvate-ferredoxin/flavodoxin oxidoreductase
LTVADQTIRIHSELKHADFVPLNNVEAFHIGNPVDGLASGGTIFLQHASRDPAEVWAAIPKNAQRTIREKGIRVLALDAVKIAQEVASKPELAQRMQGIVLLGVFLRVAPFLSGSSDEEIYRAVEQAMRKFFAKQGEQVIQDNLKAIKRGRQEVFELPRALIEAAAEEDATPAAEMGVS